MLQRFITRYYLPPIGVEPENRVFSLTHIVISSILFILLYCVIREVVKRKDQSFSRKVLKTSAVAMLFLECFRIAWNSYFHGFSITSFRFDFCNQVCMVLPFIVLFCPDSAYPYINLLAIVGGVVVLIYPLWVFYDYAGFHIMALQSLVSHALMVLCGFVMPFASGYNPQPEVEARDSIIGFSIILVVAFIMSNVTGVNYLIMKGANGVPVLQNIPYPWYWLLLLPLCYFIAIFGAKLVHNLIARLSNNPETSTSIY